MTFDPFWGDDPFSPRQPTGCARLVVALAATVVLVATTAAADLSTALAAVTWLGVALVIVQGLVWTWRRGELHRREFDSIDEWSELRRRT